MKSVEWKTYRTRFLIKAKQLSSSLSFVDALGRQHSGRKGDYLVESSDGVISIAPRQIFEDIYVAMSLTNEHQIDEHMVNDHRLDDLPEIVRLDHKPKDDLRKDAVRTQDYRNEDCRNTDLRTDDHRHDGLRRENVRRDNLRRKLAQPCNDRRAPAPRIGLM